MKYKIEPGVSLGGMKLGLTREQVREMLGDLSESLVETRGSVDVALDYYPYHGLGVYYNESGRVTAISLATPAVAEWRGVEMIGARVPEVIRGLSLNVSTCELHGEYVTCGKIGLAMCAPKNERGNLVIKSVLIYDSEFSKYFF